MALLEGLTRSFASLINPKAVPQRPVLVCYFAPPLPLPLASPLCRYASRTTASSRLCASRSVISRADNISLQGDAYHWPTGPKHTLDVQAFDSPLVLPTRGDVHMLT